MKLRPQFILAITLTLQIICNANETNSTSVTKVILSNAAQMKALKKEVDDAKAAFMNANEARQPQDQVKKLWEISDRVDEANLPKIFELAKLEPTSETAFEMFEWIITSGQLQGWALSPIGVQTVELLRDYHATNQNIAKICWTLGNKDWDPTFQPATDFLQIAADKNPAREIRGQAILSLARRNKMNAEMLTYYSESAPDDVQFEKNRIAYLERAKNRNSETVASEAEKLFNVVLDKYADCPALEPANSPRFIATLGEVVKVELYELNHLSVGKMAPEIEGEDISGKKLKLSDYRGKIVVLSFWASWCGPCMEMVPSEISLAERMKGKSFALVGVNGDAIRNNAKRAVENEKITWPSFWSNEGRDGPIPVTWNVHGWPIVYVLDPSGVIRFKGGNFNLVNRKVDQILARPLYKKNNRKTSRVTV